MMFLLIRTCLLFLLFDESLLQCTPSCKASARNLFSNEEVVLPCVESDLIHKDITNYSSFNQDLIAVEIDWYLNHDMSTNRNRIGLNITWTVSPDNAINQLKGFQLAVHNLNRRAVNTLYFNLSALYADRDDVADIFVYDCIGKIPGFNILPGDWLFISLTSYRARANGRLTRIFQIPNCEENNIRSSFECQRKEIEINVDERCACRTKTISYKVPVSLGKTSSILFCHMTKPDNPFCISQINFVENLPLVGTFAATLPMEYMKEDKYFVQIWGSHYPGIRYNKDFSFSECGIC